MGNDDDQVVDAVRTVRRLQEFCRSIGISSVRMADLEAGPGTEETDRKKSALLRRALDERLDSVAEELQAVSRSGGAGEGAAGGNGAPAAAASAAEAAPRRDCQVTPPGEKRGRQGPSPSPDAAETATEEMEKVSNWTKFKRELLRQLFIGALALAVTKLVMLMSPTGKSGLGQPELK
jgi:hypothetical protein